jgi:flavin-dependent dehydrogenase
VEQFDAIVIGGGPAGSTAALLLAEAGWSVALIEQKRFPRRKVCGEYLSATNWPLFSRLGIADLFEQIAGPPVHETAIFCRDQQYRAPLPRPTGGGCWGRALSREKLDTILLEQAIRRGVTVFQPARCLELKCNTEGFHAIIESHERQRNEDVAARVAIAAHGSWDIGDLPTQRHSMSHGSGDWLAFKAHFHRTHLPVGLMPLLSFDDGYGGMVHCDGERASLSCCIQRRRFERLKRAGSASAGDAVLTHILDSCPVLRPVLEDAEIDGPWLSAGVIQPGIRPRHKDDIFVIGNAAGEAHPVVAEGISMAMQSAWLLVERLKEHRHRLNDRMARQQLAKSYSSAWRRAFAGRIHAAAAIAHWASHPRMVQATGPLLRSFPALLTWGARLSGKSRVVVPDATRPPEAEWCSA